MNKLFSFNRVDKHYSLLLISLIFLVALYAAFNCWRTIGVVFQTLNIIGTILTIFLNFRHTAFNGRWFKKVCGQKTNYFDCEEILAYKNNNILNASFFSGMGLCYFLTQFLNFFSISISDNANYSTWIICILPNSIAVLFTLLSLYIQFLVVRKVCRLCMILIIIIWIQAILIYISSHQYPFFKFQNISVHHIVGAFFYGFISLTFFIIKPLYVTTAKQKEAKKQIAELKQSGEMFLLALKQQQYIGNNVLENDIIIGKDRAWNIVILISPFCQFCGQELNKVISILKSYPKDISLTVRLKILTNTKKNASQKEDMLKSIINILLIEEAEEIRMQILSDWFAFNDFEKWEKKWGRSLQNEKLIDSVISDTKKWTESNGLKIAPLILMEGYRFPSFYNLKDFKLFFVNIYNQKKTFFP